MQIQIRLSHYWLFRLCASLLAALLANGAFAGITEINNIRVAKNAQVTRIVLDSNRTLNYKLFTLNHPGRLVVDLGDARLATSVDQSIFKASPVKKLRHAQRAGHKLRLVFDLNKPVIAKSFILPASENFHHRLVIDLKNAVNNTLAIAKKSPSEKAVTKTAARAQARKPAQKPAARTRAPKKIIRHKKFNSTRDVVIAIDPGHGGKDPGAIGYAGTREKDVVLQISRRLAHLIKAEPGMRVVMTRNNDKFLTLRGRIKKARANKADLFISVHADAVKNRRARGSSVYVLSKNGASSEAAKILAQRENRSDMIGGVKLEGKDNTLRKVIVDLSQSAAINASLKLANCIKQELSKLGKTRQNIEYAGFAVLKSPDIPSILVETAFISNISEERKLRSASHQQKLANAVLKGIKIYLAQYAPESSQLARQGQTDRHTIQHGETLSDIATRYRVSLDALRKTNALRSDRIKAGQKLIIPGA